MLEALKRRYRKSLLQKLLLEGQDGDVKDMLDKSLLWY